MQKGLLGYAKRFSQLRVDRSRGAAPHKPVLLLAVIELAAQGILKQNRIYLSPELIAAFLKYWTQLGSESHRSDIALPFFHLCGDKFWHLKAEPGFEMVLSSKVKLKSLSALRDAVEYAYLDDELFSLLLDSPSRMSLINVLVGSWFSDKVARVEQLLQINSFRDYQEKLQEAGGRIYSLKS
jgi:putative restriction endonuclease